MAVPMATGAHSHTAVSLLLSLARKHVSALASSCASQTHCSFRACPCSSNHAYHCASTRRNNAPSFDGLHFHQRPLARKCSRGAVGEKSNNIARNKVLSREQPWHGKIFHNPKASIAFTKQAVLKAASCGQFRHFSTGRCLSQKPNFEKDMPQIGSPDTDIFTERLEEPAQAFKGLETDFPCLARVKDTGPEPAYHRVTTGFKMFRSERPFCLQLNKGMLPRLHMAYETWGKLNSDCSNAVIVLAGMSASSHARSSVDQMRPGWWERFVGPGCAVDTNKFFVICPNNFGGCYGSSGPSTENELTGKPYGTTFPIITIEDMTNAIFHLLDHLGIEKLYGAVGSSLGGMLSLQSAVLYPERVGRLIAISSCAQSHPSSIAMRYLQRKCIMVDPNWNKGHYYDKQYPKVGMKLAREIATITYRSGPEWEKRFGRSRINKDEPVSLCPTFLIESYLEHQGESFSTIYDPNSLLYMSKAMDMFDISQSYGSLEKGLSRVKCPVMVVGVQTDVLFPIWQQRELARALQDSGNEQVTFYELTSIYGHDTFLLDLNGVGAAVKGFLETEQRNYGILTKHKLAKKSQAQAKPQAKPQACVIE